METVLMDQGPVEFSVVDMVKHQLKRKLIIIQLHLVVMQLILVIYQQEMLECGSVIINSWFRLQACENLVSY